MKLLCSGKPHEYANVMLNQEVMLELGVRQNPYLVAECWSKGQQRGSLIQEELNVGPMVLLAAAAQWVAWQQEGCYLEGSLNQKDMTSRNAF